MLDSFICCCSVPPAEVVHIRNYKKIRKLSEVVNLIKEFQPFKESLILNSSSKAKGDIVLIKLLVDHKSIIII